jgi:hypothetical protein
MGITEASGGALDPLSGVNAEQVWDWIDSYCQANPTRSIADAGAAFIAARPQDDRPNHELKKFDRGRA